MTTTAPHSGTAGDAPGDGAQIEVRDLRFPLDAIPRHWHGGRRAVTLYFDNLSIFFPAGERFFVASVKAFRQHAKEPRLAAEVAAFCAQEGHHSREHVRYNRMVEKNGYPIARLERDVEGLLRFVTKAIPKRRQLAVTCALEHFTAMMAALVLGPSKLLEGAHPPLAALWRWHAAEESEHKLVAFDLFKAAGGTYFERCWTMLLATTLFWSMVFKQQVQLMHADGILFSPREWIGLFKFLFIRPGGMASMFVPWLGYFRPGFHPSQHDSQPLFDAWKAEFAETPEYQRALRS